MRAYSVYEQFLAVLVLTGEYWRKINQNLRYNVEQIRALSGHILFRSEVALSHGTYPSEQKRKSFLT
jgi:hypothetical protein